jgi:hypothetical protein
MQWTHQAHRVGVFGMSGTGKTHFVLSYLENSRASCRFIFDPEGEFSAKLRIPAARTVAELAAAIPSGWCIFDPSHLFALPEPAVKFFAEFAMEASLRLPGRKFFVVDELQEHCTGHAVPDEIKILVWRGRRRGLDSVFLAQAPNLLHNAILGQLTEMVLFRLVDNPNAMEPAARFGFAPEEIKALPNFCWVSRNVNGGEIRGGPGESAAPKSSRKLPRTRRRVIGKK